MSQESVKQFFNKVREIQELQNKLQEATGDDLVAAAVKLGAEHGCDFTEEEFKAELELSSLAAVEEGELSDEQLEAVAGAGCPYCIMTKGSYCIMTGKL